MNKHRNELEKASWHRLFHPLRSRHSASPSAGASSLLITGTTPSIDFSAVRRISENVFRVRRHTLHVERIPSKDDHPIYEIFDLTDGTGPFRIRAGSATLKKPARVGNSNAWAAQAFALTQGWMTTKGGKR